MDYQKLAKEILANVGGEENVRSVVHCATRLRFKLVNKEKADKKQIESISGVISVVENAGQLQVIIGNTVGDVYKALGSFTKLTDDGDSEIAKGTKDSDGNFLSKAIDVISGIFTPILGALAGGGMLKGLLMILTTFGWLTESSGTYQILYAAADSVFYFLPLILAYTAARKFGANPPVAIAAAGALVYPTMINLFNEGAHITFLQIPVVLMSYSFSVIPIILAVWFLSILERFLNSKIHEAAKTFLTPMICLMLIVPLTFLAFGPLGTFISQGLASGYTFIYNLSPIVAGAFMGAFWQVLVIFGIHWGFVPIMINNLSRYGRDTMIAMVGPSNFAQAGASLGVFLKTKKTGSQSYCWFCRTYRLFWNYRTVYLRGYFKIQKTICYREYRRCNWWCDSWCSWVFWCSERYPGNFNITNFYRKRICWLYSRNCCSLYFISNRHILLRL